MARSKAVNRAAPWMQAASSSLVTGMTASQELWEGPLVRGRGNSQGVCMGYLGIQGVYTHSLSLSLSVHLHIYIYVYTYIYGLYRIRGPC